MDLGPTRRTAAVLMALLVAVAACSGAASSGSAPPAASGSLAASGSPAASAPATEAPPEPVTLKVLHQWGNAESAFKEPLEAAFAGFLAENPHVTIEEEEVGDAEATRTAYETALTAGKEPDVLITVLGGTATVWAADGAVRPVNDLIDSWGLRDRYSQAAIDQYTNPDGQTAAFPLAGFTWPVWYNTKILAEAGVTSLPTTEAELIAASDAIRKAGYAPVAVGGSDWSGNKLFLLIMQASMTPEETAKVMREGGYAASAEARAGVEAFVRLRDAGVFADDSEGWTYDLAVASFMEQKAAIFHNGSWGYQQPVDEGFADNIDLGGWPLPAGSTWPNPLTYTGYGSGGIFISPNGEEKLDTIEAFVKYMFKPEVIGDFVTKASIAAPVDAKYDEAGLNPLFLSASGPLKEATTEAVMPDYNLPGDKEPGVVRATSLAFVPGTTVDEILAALDAAYQ